MAVLPSPQPAGAEPKRPLWPLLLVGALFGLFVGIYFVRAPLPFFGYFSDPEIAYIFSALQLKALGYVQMTDHPGTFLQIVGAGLAALQGFDFNKAFDLPAYNAFRAVWLGFSVASVAAAIFLVWRQLGARTGAFLIAILVLVHDGNTLMYFGRFSPEGGFVALNLLVLVLATIAAGRRRPLSLAAAVGWGALLGAATTIKITLWPVTAFAMGAFLCLRTEPGNRRQWLLWLVMPVVAMVAYLVVGSAFADDVAAQIDWFGRLLSESGRYGRADGGGELPRARPNLRLHHQGLCLPELHHVVSDHHAGRLGGVAAPSLGSRANGT